MISFSLRIVTVSLFLVVQGCKGLSPSRDPILESKLHYEKAAKCVREQDIVGVYEGWLPGSGSGYALLRLNQQGTGVYVQTSIWLAPRYDVVEPVTWSWNGRELKVAPRKKNCPWWWGSTGRVLADFDSQKQRIVRCDLLELEHHSYAGTEKVFLNRRESLNRARLAVRRFSE